MNQKAKTAIVLTTLVTGAIHVINRIQFTNSVAKNLLAYKENHYYEWRFGKIRYIKKGSGTPLLLLHDLSIGSCSYEFNKMIDELSTNHEIYAIDLLGYGLSDKPNMTYTSYLYVQLISDFVKNVIGRKADVIATGDSAPICVMACHNDPEIFNRMIFINPQSLYKLNQIPSSQTKTMKLIMETPIIGTFIYNLYTSKTGFEKRFQNEYFYNIQKINDKDISSYFEASHRNDYHCKYVYASYLGRYINTNIIHALKEINHSIYIIEGKNKEESDVIVQNYVYYNNSIESVFIDKTKHLPHLENPGEVLAQVKMFLEY